MAAQPGIDRRLSRVDMERHLTTRADASSDDVYVTGDSLDQQGFTCMHLIILEFLQMELVSTLNYHRPIIDAQDSNGRTPLLWASWRGDADKARLLLEYGASVDQSDNEGYTPLAKACEGGHLVVVRLLLKAGASMQSRTAWDNLPIHLASRNKEHGHEIVQELLRRGADPSAVSTGSGTPLHNACNRGSIATIKMLIAAGADIDALGENGDTAAMEALYCWNEAAFLYLAGANARLDVVNGSGHNILLLATWSASSVTWDLLADYAEKGSLGIVEVNILHDGHNLSHCFDRCRNVWYVGHREESELEAFRRMLRACTRLS